MGQGGVGVKEGKGGLDESGGGEKEGMHGMDEGGGGGKEGMHGLHEGGGGVKEVSSAGIGGLVHGMGKGWEVELIRRNRTDSTERSTVEPRRRFLAGTFRTPEDVALPAEPLDALLMELLNAPPVEPEPEVAPAPRRPRHVTQLIRRNRTDSTERSTVEPRRRFLAGTFRTPEDVALPAEPLDALLMELLNAPPVEPEPEVAPAPRRPRHVTQVPRHLSAEGDSPITPTNHRDRAHTRVARS
ncbi:hypothetical protein OUZ56_016957 [Daphnia magna]|uniref:Uncharacterized protein n=1 Tax=Daphnia magna TaxID=35525 RepID=A0ABR0ART4_9CRUS|nr:hypothetical protein OUZ56_016957 [Daphnia magna]